MEEQGWRTPLTKILILWKQDKILVIHKKQWTGRFSNTLDTTQYFFILNGGLQKLKKNLDWTQRSVTR